jgi:hypothetical protein
VIPGSRRTHRQSAPAEPEDYIDQYVKIKASKYPYKDGYFTDVSIRGVVFDYRKGTITLLVLHSNTPEALAVDQITEFKLDASDSIEIIKSGLD